MKSSPLAKAVLVMSTVWIGSACSGPVVPLSVQAGASVAIPLTGDRMVMPVVGFGSELTVDHQRGALVFRLRETGKELTTRATAAVRLGRSPAPSEDGRVQIVSLVDVPSDSPVGTFSIEVLRRFRDAAGIEQEEEIPYDGSLVILPHQLDIDCDQTVDVVGLPTPWTLISGGKAFDIESNVASALAQRPELVLVFNGDVRAADVEISFPADVIRIEGVAPSPGSLAGQALSWWNETSPGRVSIGLVSKVSFARVAVAFSLIDGENEILDLSSVQAAMLSSVDADGAELARTVRVSSIR